MTAPRRYLEKKADQEVSRANRQTRLNVFDVSPNTRPDLQRLLFLGGIIEALIHSWFYQEARTAELASWEIRNWLNSIITMYPIYSPFHFLYDLSSICRIEENWISIFHVQKAEVLTSLYFFLYKQPPKMLVPRTTRTPIPTDIPRTMFPISFWNKRTMVWRVFKTDLSTQIYSIALHCHFKLVSLKEDFILLCYAWPFPQKYYGRQSKGFLLHPPPLCSPHLNNKRAKLRSRIIINYLLFSSEGDIKNDIREIWSPYKRISYNFGRVWHTLLSVHLKFLFRRCSPNIHTTYFKKQSTRPLSLPVVYR